MFELTGHRALVTGAGDGMGVGIARALARQGAAVAVNDLVEERAATTVASIEDAGGRAVNAVFAVTDQEAVNAGVARAAEQLGGPIDILVNNAGVPVGMAVFPFRDMPRELWDRYIDLNIYGSLYCIKAVIDNMVRAAGAVSCRFRPARDAPD